MTLSMRSASRSACQGQPFARPGFRIVSLFAGLVTVFGVLSFSPAAEVWHDIRQAGAVGDVSDRRPRRTSRNCSSFTKPRSSIWCTRSPRRASPR